MGQLLIRRAAILLVILAATLVAFRSAGDLEFIAQDDLTVLVNNPRVAGGLTGQNLLWSLTGVDRVNWYPVTWISHQATVHLFGMDPAAHHWANVLLHVLGAALLFLALLRMTGAEWRAAAVAGLFAVHPLHVESVAWVSERSDVTAGALWGATLLAWAWYVRRPGTLRYAGVAALFALALGAKATVVTLPCLLLVLDAWPLGRSRWARGVPAAPGAMGWGRLVAEKLPLFVLAAAASAATLVSQSQAGAVKTLAHHPLWARLANAALSYVAYLKATVYPAGLALYYPGAGTGVSLGGAAAAGCALLAVTAIALRLVRRHPALLAGWLWFIGVLVPVIGLVQVGDQARADRFTYLPLTGLFVAAVWSAAEYSRNLPRRAVLGAMASVAVFAVLVTATARQVSFWKNTESVYERALAVTERNSFVEYNLGVFLDREGRADEAIAHYRAALRIDPRIVEAHVNLGASLAERGEPAAAVAHYKEAIRHDPGYFRAWFNLGVDLLALGDPAAAERALSTAARLEPDNAEVRAHLGFAHLRQGRYAEALAQYQAAVRLDPANRSYRERLLQVLPRVR